MAAIVHWVDRNYFDLGTSLQDFLLARRNGHPEQSSDAALRHVNAHAYLYYMCLSILRNSSLAYVVFADHIPAFFTSLHSFHIILGTTILGCITNTLTAIQETWALVRHVQLYQLFHPENHNNSLKVAEDLEALRDKYDVSQLASRLRPWFLREQEISSDGLTTLTDKIRAGDSQAIQDGKELIGKIQALVVKKIAVHSLGLISTAIAFIGVALTFIACPILMPTAIVSLGIVIWMVRGCLMRGWVDNPNGEFSATRCLPAWIARRFNVELVGED